MRQEKLFCDKCGKEIKYGQDYFQFWGEMRNWHKSDKTVLPNLSVQSLKDICVECRDKFLEDIKK